VSLWTLETTMRRRGDKPADDRERKDVAVTADDILLLIS